MKNLYVFILMIIACTSKAQSTMWQKLPAGLTTTNASVIDIDAPTRQICWAIGGTDNGGGLCTQPFLQFTRTINGGQSFITGNLSVPSGYKPTSISAVNELTAWITLSNTLAISPGLVYKTTDGGITWLHQNTAVFNRLACFVHFYDANEGVAIGDSLIYRTTNGGTNWVLAQNLPNNVNISTNFLYNAIEVNSNYIWIGNHYGKIFKSSNRGVSWVQTSGIVGNALQVKDIAFKDSLNGIAIGYVFVSGGNGGGNYTDNGYVFLTADGGNTWTKKYLVFGTITSWQTGQNFFSKYAVSYIPGTKNTYLLQSAYHHNTCAISHDGGNTWDMIDTTRRLTAIAAIDSNTIYAGSYFTDAQSGMYKWDIAVPNGLQPTTKLDFTIFPNPVNHKSLHINLSKNLTNGKLIVIDKMGKIVWQEKLSNQQIFTIELPKNLMQGIYQVVITDTDYLVSAKLMVED